jgi:glycosyltransferase involved in cell wall biosynthesis
LNNDVAERDNQISALTWKLNEAEQRAQNYNDQLQEVTALLQKTSAELHEIYSSKAWALAVRLRRLRLAIAPLGSSREQILRAGWRTIKAARRILGLSPALTQSEAQEESTEGMSWAAYVFDRFKRARKALYLPRLDGLRTPAIPEKVSIVLPVYNGAEYVTEALDSILAQTYTNFELIAVDDGSTDATPQILDDYAARDSRMRVIHQENQRLPGALNTGFRAAMGEYLTWSSADNRLKPDFLARMVDCLRRHPEWDAVYANVDIIGDDGKQLLNSEWYYGYQYPLGSGHVYFPEDLSELNVVANNYVGAAFMYRKRVDFLLGGYSPYRFGTEDYDFWMRVNALMDLHHVDFKEQVYDYRFHATSLTSRDEELGITRGREGLMVFEDARRDFYNTPMAWVLSEEVNPGAQECARQIREWTAAVGHVLLDPVSVDLSQMYHLWLPLVAVKVTVDPAGAVPDPAWPAGAFKVLVVAGDKSLPRTVNPAWDLCIAISTGGMLPFLDTPRKGWLSASDVETLCTAVDIRLKSTHLAELESEIVNPSPSSYKISAVICTYHRGLQLVDAIRSVAKQTFPAGDYEVLVVSNDPDDNSAGKIVNDLRETDFAGSPERLRLVVCPFKGLSFARNAAISEARGTLLCYLDDDAIAAPEWLEQVWKAYEQYPNAGVIGGSILLDPPSPRPKWAKPGWELYWSAFVPDYSQAKKVEQWGEFPFGANWSATRKALLSAGGFRTNYGRRGVDFGGGEEVIAASLLKRLGYEIVVAPAAKVYHRPDASRFTLGYVARTLKAHWLSGYRQQIDLYIPLEINLKGLRRFRREQLTQALASSRLPFYRRLENLLRARAISSAIRQLQQDLRARRRYPDQQEEKAFWSGLIQPWKKRWAEVLLQRRLDRNLKNILATHASAKGVVVFVPSITWKTSLFQRPQQMALALARKGYLTFFCEPDWSTYYAGEFHKVNDNLYVSGIVPWKIFRRLRSPIVFVLAYNRHYLDYFDHPRVIYEYIDELEVLPYELETLQRDHDELVRSADVVVATADRLYERIRSVRPDALLSPNAVDYIFIKKVIQETQEPPDEMADLVRKGRPIIGYYGALAEWFDYDLVAQAARARSDYIFLLIGPDYENKGYIGRSGIFEIPNVRWLGTRPYSDLPGYLKYFDVATIPFKLNDITHATSPIKLFEYMTAGKPVVTSALQECQKYPEVLIAHDGDEFVEKLDEALELRKDTAYLLALERLACQNTWDIRADAILKALARRTD